MSTPANLAGQFGDTTYTKVFVRGLAWETKKETMETHFEQFGEILEAVVITDKTTGKSRGYGFVTFREPEAARRACANATPVIDGRRANCSLASLGVRRSKPSPPKNGGGGDRNFRVMGSSQTGFGGAVGTAFTSAATFPDYAIPLYEEGSTSRCMSEIMKIGKSDSVAAAILKSLFRHSSRSSHSSSKRSCNSSFMETHDVIAEEEEEVEAASSRSGISRPLSEILKELNKKVPDSHLHVLSGNGHSIKYAPWHALNQILNLNAPEWSGEVRSITYSTDAKSVTVVYRVTLYGTDAKKIYRESTGTASVDDTSYGGPVQRAEAMAFRRACARFGLGLHLYHEDMS